MNKKRLAIYGSAVAASLIIVVLCVGKITNKVTELLMEDTVKHLNEITSQTLNIVQQETDNDIMGLQNLATTIAVLGGPESAQAKDFILQEVWKNEGERLTVSKSNGESYTNDGLTGNISDEAIFKRAMAGERVISDVRPEMMKADEDKSIIIIVPIYKDGAVVGTLASSNNTSHYAKLVDFSVFNGKGYNHIIKPDGEAVVLGGHKENGNDLSKENVLKDKELLEKSPVLAQFKADMENKASGSLKFSPEDSEELYLSYAPLGINDWYLVSSVNSEDVDGQRDLLRMGAIVITIALAFLFGALLVGFFISNKRRIKAAEKVAMYDNLTGMPNWRFMQKYYSELKTTKYRTYLILRIPDFSRISAVFGYSVAARLLKDIAKELLDTIKEGEIAVHVSEDCFALFLEENSDLSAVEKRIDEIFARVKIVEITDGNNIYNYHFLFVGGAYKIEKSNEEFSVVNRRANIVIESSNGEGEKPWAWFSPSMESKLLLQDSLMPDIVNALKNEEFVPFFQPQYDVNTKDIVGAEVLARWQHPSHGTLLPGVFVPLLESSGCVLELDLIMLEQACKMIRGWLDGGLLPVYLSVNISRLNIHRQDFFERLVGIVKKYDIPPSLISLELGEMAASENSEKVINIARTLKQDGFILALDDFKTGSSLNILQDLPINTVKLARDFLLNFEAGERGNTVLKHVVDMSHELGFNIVAEGIETQEQDGMVKAIGCDFAQGFFYNRPMSGMDFEDLMFKENGE